HEQTILFSHTDSTSPPPPISPIVVSLSPLISHLIVVPTTTDFISRHRYPHHRVNPHCRFPPHRHPPSIDFTPPLNPSYTIVPPTTDFPCTKRRRSLLE
ncbi:hypothetical protein LINPERPRIM_LOCUS39771, partial [Linum perenne]